MLNSISLKNVVKKPKKNRRMSKSVNIDRNMSHSLLSNSRASKTISVPGSEKVVYKCDQCSSVCSSKSGFVRHKCQTKNVESIQLSLSRDGDNQVFKCTVCDKVVSSKTGLKRHMTMKHKNTNSQSHATTITS